MLVDNGSLIYAAFVETRIAHYLERELGKFKTITRVGEATSRITFPVVFDHNRQSEDSRRQRNLSN